MEARAGVNNTIRLDIRSFTISVAACMPKMKIITGMAFM